MENFFRSNAIISMNIQINLKGSFCHWTDTRAFSPLYVKHAMIMISTCTECEFEPALEVAMAEYTLWISCAKVSLSFSLSRHNRKWIRWT